MPAAGLPPQLRCGPAEETHPSGHHAGIFKYERHGYSYAVLQWASSQVQQNMAGLTIMPKLHTKSCSWRLCIPRVPRVPGVLSMSTNAPHACRHHET
jgi:hypothetical protein